MFSDLPRQPESLMRIRTMFFDLPRPPELPLRAYQHGLPEAVRFLCDTGAETVRALTAGLGSSVLASAEGCSRADGCTPMAVRTAPARAALARTDIQPFPVPAVADGIVMDTDIDAGNADVIV